MLLVLDLDGCILDTGSWKHEELATELFARPHLHEMLSLVSPYYDVIIWSQTAWIYLERKIIELEMIGPTARGDYHIVSCLDKSCMFSVYSEKEGKAWTHQVKVSSECFKDFCGQAALTVPCRLSESFGPTCRSTRPRGRSTSTTSRATLP